MSPDPTLAHIAGDIAAVLVERFDVEDLTPPVAALIARAAVSVATAILRELED